MTGRLRHYLDANVVISVIEATRAYGATQARFIRRIDDGEVEAVTSELTLAECLVKPFADRDLKAIGAYLTFLDGRTELPTIAVSRDVLLEAARWRGATAMKLPDAIHVATAVSARCDRFVTNDRRIKLPDGLAPVWWDRLGGEETSSD